MKRLIVFLIIATFPFTLFAQDLTGSWEANMHAFMESPCVYTLNLLKTGDSEYSGVITVKQGAYKDGFGKLIPQLDVKMSITGRVVDGLLKYKRLAIIEFEGDTTHWTLRDTWLKYFVSNGKEDLSSSNIQANRKSNVFSDEYRKYTITQTAAVNAAAFGDVTDSKTRLLIHLLTDYHVWGETWVTGDSVKYWFKAKGNLGKYVGDMKNNSAWGKGKLCANNGDVLLDGVWYNSFYVGRALERSNLNINPQNYSADVMDIFVSQEMDRWHDNDVYIPGNIKNIAYSPLKKTIRADIKYYDKNKNILTGWVELGVDAGLPIYTVSSIRPNYYTSVLDINWLNNRCFSPEQRSQIHQLNNSFLRKIRYQTASFKNVLLKQSNYAANVDGLYIDTVRSMEGGQHYTTTKAESAYNSDGSIGLVDVQIDHTSPYYAVKHAILVNPTNHTIYVKGLKVERDYDGKTIYTDNTMMLKPNSQTNVDYMGNFFNPSYDKIGDEYLASGGTFYLGYGIKDKKGKVMTNPNY